MKTLLCSVIALLSTIVSVPAACAGGLRIALLTNVEVHGDSIVLANLLPPAASRYIRDAAGKISLGAAPQSGTARQFDRATLVSAITASGLPLENFTIPSGVSVTRGSRLISREEVYAAIQSSLAQNPVPGIPALSPNDIELTADIRVPAGDAGLEVTQVTFDPFNGRARFRLWAKSAPGVLPFFVFIKAAVTFAQRSAVLHAAASTPQAPDASTDAGLILVAADRPARLHLHSSNLDMVLGVRPLQRGRLGEIIRIRLIGSARTMQARVTGEGFLDATL